MLDEHAAARAERHACDVVVLLRARRADTYVGCRSARLAVPTASRLSVARRADVLLEERRRHLSTFAMLSKPSLASSFGSSARTSTSSASRSSIAFAYSVRFKRCSATARDSARRGRGVERGLERMRRGRRSPRCRAAAARRRHQPAAQLADDLLPDLGVRTDRRADRACRARGPPTARRSRGTRSSTSRPAAMPLDVVGHCSGDSARWQPAAATSVAATAAVRIRCAAALRNVSEPRVVGITQMAPGAVKRESHERVGSPIFASYSAVGFVASSSSVLSAPRRPLWIRSITTPNISRCAARSANDITGPLPGTIVVSLFATFTRVSSASSSPPVQPPVHQSSVGQPSFRDRAARDEHVLLAEQHGHVSVGMRLR